MNIYIKVVAAILIIAASYNISMACNACGSMAASSGTSLLSYTSKHTIGLNYSRQTFKMDNHGNSVFDQYNQWNIALKIHAADWLELSGSIPYIYNSRQQHIINTKIHGVGDPKIFADIIIFNTIQDVESRNNIKLTAGAGVKIPFGASSIDDYHSSTLPANFVLHNGSIDWILRSSFTLVKNNFGTNATIFYQYSTENEHERQFGCQLSSDLSGFYKITAGKNILAPLAGVYFENIAANELHREDEEGTGGSGLFAKAGIEFHFSQIALAGQLKYPVAQNYAEEMSVANSRYNLNLIYKF